jgi:hypothetical protein
MHLAFLALPVDDRRGGRMGTPPRVEYALDGPGLLGSETCHNRRNSFSVPLRCLLPRACPLRTLCGTPGGMSPSPGNAWGGVIAGLDTKGLNADRQSFCARTRPGRPGDRGRPAEGVYAKTAFVPSLTLPRIGLVIGSMMQPQGCRT